MDAQVIGVFIQAATLLVLAGTLFFIGRQVSAAATELRANHDWNRRIAAQDALMQQRQRVLDSGLLEKEFQHTTTRDPISLEKINCAFKELPELRRALHSYLNYYEALARGVRQAVYDEKMIKVGCRGIMKRNWIRFGHYIAHRRNGGSPNAWLETEHLLNQWQKQDGEPEMRLPTA